MISASVSKQIGTHTSLALFAFSSGEGLGELSEREQFSVGEDPRQRKGANIIRQRPIAAREEAKEKEVRRSKNPIGCNQSK